MEKILANIHSTNRPDLQQFQTEIDGIQKEAARNNASRAKQQKAKSRRASPGKSSDDDTAHQVMDGDPAVLQVISTADDWSSVTYKMSMKKNKGRLFYLSHDYEVNAELSGPESLIKLAIYDLKCKKGMFTAAFVETNIYTPRRAAGSLRSFVTLHPPNFEWRDTQIVHINPAMRAFEFEITVAIHRIPQPSLHLPICFHAITSILDAKPEPVKAELPDGLKALFRAFSVDNKTPVLAVSSETAPCSEKAAQEQKEIGQSAVAPVVVTEADSVMLQIKAFERSLRLIKERNAAIQPVADPRSDTVQEAKSQSIHAAGDSEIAELPNRVDSDKEVSLDAEPIKKPRETSPSANVQSCLYGNGECSFRKFALGKSCSERAPQNLEEKRQPTHAAGGVEIEKLIEAKEVRQDMEPTKKINEREPNVTARSQSSEFHVGSFGRRLKGLMSTPLSKKEKKEEGQSTDAGRGAEPEKLIKVEEVGLAMESTQKATGPAASVTAQPPSSEFHGGSFGQRLKGLVRTPLSKKALHEHKGKGQSTDAAGGAENEKLIVRAVLDEEITPYMEPTKEQNTTVHSESFEVHGSFSGERLKRKPRSVFCSPEHKDGSTGAGGGTDLGYLIEVVPYEEVALDQVPSKPTGQAFKTPEPRPAVQADSSDCSFRRFIQGLRKAPNSEEASKGKKEKGRSAHASIDADLSYLEIRIVPYEEVALDESTKQSEELQSSATNIEPTSPKVRYGSFGQRLQGRKMKPSSKKEAQTQEDKGQPALASVAADLGDHELDKNQKTMGSLPKFDLPFYEDNPAGWGPSLDNNGGTLDQFKDMPFQLFNKCDRIGRAAFWCGGQPKRLKMKLSSKKAAQTQGDKRQPALATGDAGLDDDALDKGSTKESSEATPGVAVPSNSSASRELSIPELQQEILGSLRRILAACERMPAKQNTGTHSPSMSQAAPKEAHDASKNESAG